MLGYWNRPEETALAIRNGWFHTGDVAVMDPDGYFRIVDRLKEMILVSGFNVYPNEIEDALYRHPKISKVAVIGVPDEQTGEAVKAFVVLREGESATVEELIAWARDPANGLTALPDPQADRAPRQPPRDDGGQGAPPGARRGGASQGRDPRLVSPLPADLGEGAVLRRLTMADLDEIWALVELERPRLEPWMPWIDATRTIDDQRKWLEGVVHDQGSLDGCGIFVDGRYAGGVGLRWDPFGVRGEIGYWISVAEEGRGLVTRAVRALIDVGFGDLGLHRIEIRAGVDNLRSRAIPERLGFVREGIERGGERGANGFYDLVVYAILEDEWPRPR